MYMISVEVPGNEKMRYYVCYGRKHIYLWKIHHRMFHLKSNQLKILKYNFYKITFMIFNN